MSRLSLALILILGLVGCRNPQQPELLNRSSKTSHIEELLSAPGGPRVITPNLGGGRVDELVDANDRSNTIPGFVSVNGISIKEGSKNTAGIMITLDDSTFPDEKQDRKSSKPVTMDADEALEFKDAVNQEIKYGFACMKNPPKHKGFIIWQSEEGLSISVSSNIGNAAFFTLSAPGDAPDSGSIYLSLSLDGGRKLVADVDSALNTANGED